MKNIYKDILYEKQKLAVDKSLEQESFFLALEPGAGKTLTSLSVFQERGFKKLLVVCQTSKLTDWEKEIKETLGIKTLVLDNGVDKDERNIKEFTEGAIIVAYGTSWRRKSLTKMLDKEWFIIIDESQYLKNHKSKIGAWGIDVSSKVKHTLLLSGTPVNVPEDMYAQMKILGMEMTWKEFSDAFLIIEEKTFQGSRWPAKVIVGYKNLDLLFKAFETQSIAIKTDDIMELPMEVWTDINLKHDKIKEYRKVNRPISQGGMVYEELIIPSAGVLFLRNREMASGYIEQYKGISNHKKVALQDLLETNPNNFLIFYSFVQELEDIKEVCKNMGIEVYEFNGATKNGYDSKHSKKRFVIAAHYITGAAGLNLQHLNNTLYYSPPLSFIDYKQSWARTRRIGQTERCFYYKFVTNGTVEEKIYRTLAEGKDYDERVFERDLKEGE